SLHHAAQSDVVITSAQVPGKAAPLLVTEGAVRNMKHGSVIVDLAASTGGNCALTSPGETVEIEGVAIMAPLNLAATVPVHASQLYSRNLVAFLELLVKDGALNVDLSNEILNGSCVAHEGKAVNRRVRAALEAGVV
ncbi:MAG TPA: NAD(P)(+) transhydrogenase (Re/Si-specific) subunit alpha, partial [Blastocatellia bacterium]|nr:NAD(P)(+) transhydrogenase (Re/Si-specific) subunit alpha [Blastocatellia bacterium]